MKTIRKGLVLMLSALCMLYAQCTHAEGTKGIYLTQYTLENTNFLNNLVKNAKEAGIDTFVIDMDKPTKKYKENIKIVLDSHIKYIARITMFPGGGTSQQIDDTAGWQKKYNLVQSALDLGATGIQLDYIRYNTKQKPSAENAKKIHAIIDWFKTKLAAEKVPLQIDVFGVASFGESKYIGQNIKLFSQSVDVVCPMVYPSHYTPFPKHFREPYQTVYESLRRIQDQFDEDKQMPVKMVAYIELSNYHYPMSHQNTLSYIKAQVKAVADAKADGFYAWSPHNRYDNLFYVLKNDKTVADHPDQQNKEIDD